QISLGNLNVGHPAYATVSTHHLPPPLRFQT
ncbi:hypothetical protein Hypma_006045, partial [Hypsizygus marmoreus]